MRIFVSSSLILLLTFGAFGQNHYYVSNSGNDATYAVNDSTRPMKSMTRVNSILASNPTVATYFHFRGGDTWNDTGLVVSRSGAAGRRIYYTYYDTAGRGKPSIICWGDSIGPYTGASAGGWANTANWSLYDTAPVAESKSE